jgi:hypothetical protein
MGLLARPGISERDYFFAINFFIPPGSVYSSLTQTQDRHGYPPALSPQSWKGDLVTNALATDSSRVSDQTLELSEPNARAHCC